MTESFTDFLTRRFPHLDKNTTELISENLLSPFSVRLPLSILREAQDVVSHLFQMREDPNYQKQLMASAPSIAQFDPGNKSICMSYDFHVGVDGHLKLIEVNTNASFLLMGILFYQFRNLPMPIPEYTLETLRSNWNEEAQLNGHSIQNMAIVDEDPTSQRLYIEFLLYKELFEEFGWSTVICNPNDIVQRGRNYSFNGHNLGFIYNRSTDFYLESSSHKCMKEAYLSKSLTLSPTPFEYFLLADKHRLLEWSQIAHDEKCTNPYLVPIKKNLLKSTLLSNQNQAELWDQRKSYFFKPLQSFGSKGTYRGEGISRRYYQQLADQGVLAQEYCPAPEISFLGPEKQSDLRLKYDLRFYAYKGQVQMAIARLYQGQMTNLRTFHGGFAPLIFE